MKKLNKVMAIHDMSCYGRASLTSIIPIISAMGIQVCPLPTAVLSTHTGGYGKPEVCDLSDFMNGTAKHWKEIGIKFDCIYTGYLASVEQVKLAMHIIDNFQSDENIIIIDPVMADNGKLYGGFDESIVLAMKNYIRKANVITPNITEAALLLGEDYNLRFDYDIVDAWARELSKIISGDVIITSAPSRKGESYIDSIVYNFKKQKVTRVSVKKIGGSYPGTGDAFASVLVGDILNGDSILKATTFASNFIMDAIKYTNKFDVDSKEGILLERVLGMLTERQ